MQKAWDETTQALKAHQTTTPLFIQNIKLLIKKHSLDDILLKWFHGSARLHFTDVALQFQTIIYKTADQLQAVEAISLADEHWTQWHQTGLQLSAAISQARGLDSSRDFTTEQLRASFNVVLFETELANRSSSSSNNSNTTRVRSKQSGQQRTLIRFAAVVEKYFRSVFNETHRSAGFGLSDDEEEGEVVEVEEEEEDNDTNSELYNNFKTVCAQLRSLCWVDRLEPAFTSVLYEKVETHIRETCQDEFEEPLLSQLDDWMKKVALPWLKTVHDPQQQQQQQQQHGAHRSWIKRLYFHMYTTFGNLRISELFNIIKDYPDSEPAIVDLRSCLKRTHHHKQLTISLRNAFDQRLLHPGAETNSILIIYVATIKALRLLDSTGVLLESVSQAIKNYLRGRDDTIRKIVEHLTNPDGTSELFRELVESETTNTLIQQDDDVDGEDVVGGIQHAANTWMPDSIDADPTRSSRSRRLSDILSMLVQIYGSKKLFVTEYRTLLAKKLLKNTTFNTDQEVYTLERLKQRFGEAPLHPCEIMMKDVADSRRINNGITTSVNNMTMTPEQRNAGLLTPTKAKMKSMIISKEYWPKLQADTPCNLHPLLSQAHNEFAKQYSSLKAPRKLRWKNNLGMINLNLSFSTTNGDVPKKSFNYQVTPAQATVILHLKDQKRWTLLSLARKIGVQETSLRRMTSTWLSQGVVREMKDEQGVACFEVVENYGENEEDEDENNEGEEGEVEEDEMMDSNSSSLDFQMYENYITMMLANFGELPLDGIHNKLTMFVMGGDQEITMSQLRTFLNQLVSEEKILFNGQCYTKVG